ncbi:MAG: HAMP domain-containing histidine kinase [Actinomycetales bacterium]|nr:HAMP domain-containing histidine kinase [Actinomycetales bacterium]
MIRRLLIAMTALVAIVAAALAIPLGAIVSADQRAAFVRDLEVQTLATASMLASQRPGQWSAIAESTANATGARVVIVDADRQLVSDSDDSGLDRLFDRPEIDAALAGALASDVRRSQTLGTDLRFVAAPVVQDLRTVAAVRLSLPEGALDARISRTMWWLAAFVVAVIIAAGLIAWMLSRSIAAPLRRLADLAGALPDDLSLRAAESDGPREVRAVAHALNETAVRLSGLVDRTEQVAVDASHHLKTPLTGVRLRLEAIEDITEQDDVREQATAATAEVDRLSRRIDQVLALARTDAGAHAGDACDASAVVEDRIVAASVVAVERGLQLEPRIEDGVYVAAGAGMLARAIDELLGNAFAYATSHVRVSLHRQGELVQLIVEDDGQGLPEAERAAVFDRFHRGPGAVHGGSGLGLALVRESARACGGDAWAQASDLGGLAVHTSWPDAGRSVPIGP